MIKITDEIFVRPHEVISVEREIVNEYRSSSPSDGYYIETFNGSRIILKNGRKIYVPEVMPQAIIEKLTPTPESEEK